MKTQTSAVLLALCLGASGASLASADSVASLSAREDAFSAHQHSEDFLRFMRKHGKKYCEGERLRGVRSPRANLQLEQGGRGRAQRQPWCVSSPPPTASSRTPKCSTPRGRTFSALTPSVLALLPSHPDRGFNMEMGRFSDLSEEEFGKTHLKYRPSSREGEQVKLPSTRLSPPPGPWVRADDESYDDLPASFSWTEPQPGFGKVVTPCITSKISARRAGRSSRPTPSPGGMRCSPSATWRR